MSDDVLSSLQLGGDGEGIDPVVCLENVGRGPFTGRVFARLCNLEPNGTGERIE